MYICLPYIRYYPIYGLLLFLVCTSKRSLVEFWLKIDSYFPVLLHQEMFIATKWSTLERSHICVIYVVEVRDTRNTFPSLLDNLLICYGVIVQNNLVFFLLCFCSGFNNLSNLKEHKRTHTTDKTFTCDQCGKSFNTHRKLLKHKARHAGEKPHSCATCGKE